MVAVNCPTGQKTFLRYQLGSQVVQHNEVTEYFLYSPNQVPVTKIREQYVHQGRTGTFDWLIIYSTGSVKLASPTNPNFSQNRYLIDGWGIDPAPNSDSSRPSLVIQYWNRYASTSQGTIDSLEQFLLTNNPGWSLAGYKLNPGPQTFTKIEDYVLPVSDFSWFMYQHDRQYSGGIVNQHVQYPIRPPLNLWRLVVKKGTAVVEAVSFSSQPTITTGCSGQQCPPNTCEVDCGSYVCCYGADGISVFNYNK